MQFSVEIVEQEFEDKKMFCEQCGKQNLDNAKFCASCGTALAKKEVADSNRKIIAKSSKKSLLTVVCVGLGVFVLIGAVLLFNFIRNEKEYKRAIEIAEEYYEEQSNTDMAIRHYERAIEMKSKRVEAYVGLAHIYRDLKSFEDSLYYLELAEEKGNNVAVEIEDLKEYQFNYEFMKEMFEAMEYDDFDTVLELFNSERSEMVNDSDAATTMEIQGYTCIYDYWDGFYYGETRDGKRHGYGRQWGPYNESYYVMSGYWEDDAENGYCNLTYARYGTSEDTRMEFYGEFVDGRMDGEIEVYWNNIYDDSTLYSGYVYANDGAFECIDVIDDERYVWIEDEYYGEYWYAPSEESLENNGVSPFVGSN